jgi:hypothetical protein
MRVSVIADAMYRISVCHYHLTHLLLCVLGMFVGTAQDWLFLPAAAACHLPMI